MCMCMCVHTYPQTRAYKEEAVKCSQWADGHRKRGTPHFQRNKSKHEAEQGEEARDRESDLSYHQAYLGKSFVEVTRKDSISEVPARMGSSVPQQ